MGIIFVLTSIALAIVGIPLWLALAFLAGLLVFIPNFGSIIASVPTIIVAFSVSPNTALAVGILSFAIQILEGAFITPKVQHWLMKIPPALIILAQIFCRYFVRRMRTCICNSHPADRHDHHQAIIYRANESPDKEN